jgi:ubiquinone biosynthesis protein
MTLFQTIRLFRMLLSPKAKLDLDWIQRQGLLAIKIGQIYATRSDLLPTEKCRMLGGLLNKAAALSPEAFRARWQKVSSPELLQALSEFSEQPFAAASVGQVHLGQVGNQRVVVKLLKEDNKEAFLQQTAGMRKLFKWLLFFKPSLERVADPMGVLASVESATLREMDLREEIRGREKLESLRQYGLQTTGDSLPHLKNLHFPEVYPQISSRQVLVSEFIPYPSLNEWLDRGEFPYEAMLELFRIHGWFLFFQGTFHGDLHPGNVLWAPGRGFWFLDNATVESSDPTFCRGLLKMILLLGQGSYRESANTLLNLATNRAKISPKTAETFVQGFERLYSGFAGKSVGEVSMTRQMMESFKLAVSAGFAFPQGAFPIIKSLMHLDGMAIRCNPQARLLEDVARYANDFTADEPVESLRQ